MENIVVGIEGTVGSGKTSISRELLKEIDNSIILHGGNIYRAIVYGITNLKNDKQCIDIEKVDAFEMMKKIGIEIRLENRETVIYINNKMVDEKQLQSQESSINVSKMSNKADNRRLYEFGKLLINKYREKYNVILSSRDIVKMYPEVTYHFFINADLDERVERKYIQYEKNISKNLIRKTIIERDELQEKSGYYKIYPQTIVIDVTKCKNPNEAAKLLLENMEVVV